MVIGDNELPILMPAMNGEEHSDRYPIVHARG